MKMSANEVNKISKGDPKITGYFNGLFAVISKQSEIMGLASWRAYDYTIVACNSMGIAVQD